MDEAGIVALVTGLADRSSDAPHPAECFTLWLRDLPAEERSAVEDWAHRHGGMYVRKEISVRLTPGRGRGQKAQSIRPAYWVLPLGALRAQNDGVSGLRSSDERLGIDYGRCPVCELQVDDFGGYIARDPSGEFVTCRRCQTQLVRRGRLRAWRVDPRNVVPCAQCDRTILPEDRRHWLANGAPRRARDGGPIGAAEGFVHADCSAAFERGNH